MSYQPQNGAGGWPLPQQNGRHGLLDLGKGGLGLGMVATIAWGLFVAGQTWGSWQSTMTKLSEQVAKMEVTSTRTDQRLSAIETTLARLDQRWAVEVRK
jgi:hypothetical protein